MKQINYILGMFIFIMIAGSCGKNQKKTTEIESAANNNILITHQQFQNGHMLLGSMEEQDFPEIVQTTGMIDVPPENRAVVSATMGGYIRKTPLLIGDLVKKGQVLVTIENPDFVTLQQEYLEIKERLSYLKTEYERQKLLFEEKISSQKNFLQTESEYKSAQATYNGLRKKLQMINISPKQVENGSIFTSTSIYAPIKGSVTKVYVNKGTYVSPASPILEIIDNSHIHLELSVYEKDIMKIKKDQQIQFKIPESSSELYKAEVHLIGTSINENRNIKVHGHLDKETQNNFLTGMFVEAAIVTNTAQFQALPSDAVVTINDISYVLQLVNENEGDFEFKKVEVKTARTYNGFTNILDAEKFNTSDRFLINNVFNIIGE